jgi:abortive infection bacteriophage resistance protein
MLWLLQLIPLLPRIHKVTLAAHHTIPCKKPITKTTSNQSFITQPLNVVKTKNKNMLFILYNKRKMKVIMITVVILGFKKMKDLIPSLWQKGQPRMAKIRVICSNSIHNYLHPAVTGRCYVTL